MMARTTISLPDELKARMDSISERVNWSEVAADAFKARLTEIENTRDVKREIAETWNGWKGEVDRQADPGAGRAGLLHDILMKAEWREEKAQEYPEDWRNLNCAKSLIRLAKHIVQLPTNHNLFKRLKEVDDAVEEAGHAEPLIEELDFLLSRFGFGKEEDPDEGVDQLMTLYDVISSE